MTVDLSAPLHDTTPNIYVVVLNWNGASDTLACIASLHQLEHTNFRVVVCDNASRPDDLARLRQGLQSMPHGLVELQAQDLAGGPADSGPAHAAVTLIHTGGNLGYAGGMNAGMRFAIAQGDASHVWLLNNDTEVHPGALAAMLARMAAEPRIGICGCTLIYHGRRDMVQAWGGASYQAWRGRSAALGAFTATAHIPSDPAPVEARMAYVVGASMLVSRQFINTVGLMDPSYFLYSEEHDWAHRGMAHGFRLGWAPGARVFHKHGATIGTAASGGSALSLFYLYRNKALFAARHHPAKLPLVLLWLAWDNLKFLLKGHPRKAWAGLRGMLAFPGLGRF